ncbi:peroxisomal sarcosine oxidase-like [Scylla paramamosain]|uniref:peroxisomal sarcosine oxidase-like n=1 Tax=Scylla paramamosain TaxID=85552 RepID=UPI00308389C1
MAPEKVDVVVLGAGVIGSCAALSLRRAGQNTLLIDQFRLPHNNGSSGGQARIIRLANVGPPQLTPIMDDAYKQWLQISDLVKEELISPAPLLHVSRSEEKIKQAAASMELVGKKPVWLTSAQTNAKYSTRFTDDFMIFEDTTAGVMRADRCIAAVQRLYREAGGRVLDGWPVTKVEAGRPWLKLKGPRGEVQARALVLCAGPWAASLLESFGVRLPLRTVRTQALFWENKKFPQASFLDLSTKNYHYGLPALDADGRYKMGKHAGVVTLPGTEVDLSELTKETIPFINKYLPFEADKPNGKEYCWYTVSPDGECILDRCPKHPNIVYATGFTGAGFKLGPTVGDILTGMVLGRDHGFDVSPFGAARFADFKTQYRLHSKY